ncbi:CRP-like cAMP-binding protein [Chryseobacterium sp. 52]|uniref:Crp/Fnr family transcriptional regulator n=1 Tax=Chryseobacterium sp. 52 TaxID=2035213 RepID=UPI000C173C3C|nr:Crp/Fnr family transcriptional regulator [Chryseobacterium sp. 52]PIF45933.1 CRP-like cAMP-binding protein [Chryseobacterium sp. 52]
MNTEQNTYNKLIEYIQKYSATLLTTEDQELIIELVKLKKYRKKQYFLQEGEICKYSAFIVKGAMRQYRVDDDGKEYIINLFLENWWVTDRESSVMLKPTIYNIDTWEDTEVLIISQADMFKLMHIPAINEVINHLDTNHSIAMQNRINNTISLNVIDRYNKLAETYPEFLKRFPQHIIASYLGITKETLSRVRSQKS